MMDHASDDIKNVFGIFHGQTGKVPLVVVLIIDKSTLSTTVTVSIKIGTIPVCHFPPSSL